MIAVAPSKKQGGGTPTTSEDTQNKNVSIDMEDMDARVEARAREMAAEVIQARVRKKHGGGTPSTSEDTQHKNMSIDMHSTEARARAHQDALARQMEDEEARVEARAREMAAEMVQARVRDNVARKAVASKV